ncbi:hypothetical protein [Bradyrhizobium sp.]|uniref:hypothetical protein n=1 Tax=Bradyrhizobium sp. TaxID=376 RepID=UPI0025C21F88|nr:hypothetical protein [Bradyrhizobium sp.]
MRQVSITSIIVSTTCAASSLCQSHGCIDCFRQRPLSGPQPHGSYVTTKEGGAWYDPETGKWYNKSCGCVANQGGGSSDRFGGSYGRAEIHKKNVPTVTPSGVKPSNIDVHTMRIGPPRMPAEVRPTTTIGR